MRKNHIARFREFTEKGIFPEVHLRGLIEENRNFQVEKALKYLGLCFGKSTICDIVTGDKLKKLDDERFRKKNGDIIGIEITTDTTGLKFDSYTERAGVKISELSIHFCDDSNELLSVDFVADVRDLASVSDKVNNHPNFDSAKCSISFSKDSFNYSVCGTKDDNDYTRSLLISRAAIDLEQGMAEKEPTKTYSASKRLSLIAKSKAIKFIDDNSETPIELSDKKSAALYLTQSLYTNQKTANDIDFIRECVCLEYPALEKLMRGLTMKFTTRIKNAISYADEAPDKRAIDEIVDSVFNSYSYDNETEK